MRASNAARVGEPRGETSRLALTVDELLAAPERVGELTPAEAFRTVARLAAITPALMIRSAEREPQPPAATPARDELLRVPAAAVRLSMTRRRVYALVRAGVLPSVATGKRTFRISASAIDAWIRERSSDHPGGPPTWAIVQE